jgi:hypothetical protein
MGRTALQNFKRRFGDPPRITVRFVDIDSEPDRDYRYQRIFEAWVVMLRSLLGREPTEAEIFGMKDIRQELAKTPGQERTANV